MKIRSIYITILKVLLLLSIAVLLWQYARTTNFSEVLPAIQQVGKGFGYVLATTFMAYWLGTLSWWYCLGSAKTNISRWRLFTIRHVCETVGLFNPASFAGADMLKVIILKPYEISRDTVVSSVIISRMLMITSQMVLVSIAVTWLIVNKDLGFGFFSKIGIVVLALLILTVAGFIFYKFIGSEDLRNTDKKIIGKKSWLSGIRARIRSIREELYHFSRRHQKDLVLAFLFSLLHWIVGSLEFYILLKLLGFDIIVMDGLLVDMGVILVKSAGAFIPGQIGVEEVGNRMMLGLIGIGSASLWISVSVLRRARQMIWILAGAIFYVAFIRMNKVYA